MPGIYFHSLFGSRNWRAGVEESERYRTINRQQLDAATLDAEWWTCLLCVRRCSVDMPSC
ncbi:MAG: hypothetical protein R2873_06610 [Caldilineaceae bacterium]